MSLIIFGAVVSCTLFAPDYSTSCGGAALKPGTPFTTSFTPEEASLSLGGETFSFDPSTIFVGDSAASASYLEGGSGTASGYSLQFFTLHRGVFDEISGDFTTRYYLSAPEPAAWLSMLLGFSFLGATLRRKPLGQTAQANRSA